MSNVSNLSFGFGRLDLLKIGLARASLSELSIVGTTVELSKLFCRRQPKGLLFMCDEEKNISRWIKPDINEIEQFITKNNIYYNINTIKKIFDKKLEIIYDYQDG